MNLIGIVIESSELPDEGLIEAIVDKSVEAARSCYRISRIELTNEQYRQLCHEAKPWMLTRTNPGELPQFMGIDLIPARSE